MQRRRARLFHEAAGLGLDCFLTGEASEFVTHLAAETGIGFWPPAITQPSATASPRSVRILRKNSESHMNTSTCPIRSERWLALLLSVTLLAGCSTPQPTTPQPVANTPPAKIEETAPSVLIRNRRAAQILDEIVRYRTQKGMKLVARDSQRVGTVDGDPEIESARRSAHDLFAVARKDGLRLTAQVFHDTRQGKRKKTSDVTAGLRDKRGRDHQLRKITY